MTLRFILGPAGSGKTHTCIREMAGLIAAEPLGHPLLLLTPQQSTFIYEKRLAAACMAMAQTGQYNLERCRKRGDAVAELATVSRFQEAAMKAVFLLETRFKPYYKWAWKSLCLLSPTGIAVGELLEKMALDRPDAPDLAEQVCDVIVRRLIADGLSRPGDSFLTFHALELMSRIRDERLRSLPPQFE